MLGELPLHHRGTSQHNSAQRSRSIPKARGIQERWQTSHRRVPEHAGRGSKQSLQIHPKTAIQLLGSQISPGQEGCSIPACPREVGHASTALCTLIMMAVWDRGAHMAPHQHTETMPACRDTVGEKSPAPMSPTPPPGSAAHQHPQVLQPVRNWTVIFKAALPLQVGPRLSREALMH